MSCGLQPTPAGQISSAPGLEADDDVGDLHVPLLLQLGQDAGSEEHFALTDAVQVRVQLQGFDLRRGARGRVSQSVTGDAVLSAAPAVPYHELAGLLAVHEALGDGAGSEDFVPARRTRATRECQRCKFKKLKDAFARV